MGEKDWDRNGSFMKKPSSGWLHDDHALMNGDGIFYAVRYIGSIRMDKSMSSMQFDTRTEVTREAIRLVCEAAGLMQPKKRKVSQITRQTLTQNPLIRNWDVKFTISTAGIALVVVQTNEIIANHIMPTISFATGGASHGYTTLGYVAKDSRNIRECHVFECGDMAQEIMATLGQAFELRYKSFLKKAKERQRMKQQQGVDQAIYGDESGVSYDTASGDPQYQELPDDVYGDHDYTYGDNSSLGGVNFPSVRRDPTYDAVIDDTYGDLEEVEYEGVEVKGYLDITGAMFEPGKQVPMGRVYDNPDGAGQKAELRLISENPDYDYATDIPDYDEDFDQVQTEDLMQAPRSTVNRELSMEPWFHGQVSRKTADNVLERNGDFFVRESMQARGQYILSAMQGNQRKHLLLVDPTGQVRTKDMAFDSVSHLINYHLRARLPIISRGSRIVLGQPIDVATVGYSKLGKM